MTAVMPVVDPHSGDVLTMATSKRYGINKTVEGQHPHRAAGLHQLHQPGARRPTSCSRCSPRCRRACRRTWQFETPSSPKGYTYTNCASDTPVHQRQHAASRTCATRRSPRRRRSRRTPSSSASPTSCSAATCSRSSTSPRGWASTGSRSRAATASLTVAQSILGNTNATELVLGDIGTSPLEMAGAYAAVANGGVFNAPAPILSITDSSGQGDPGPKRPPAVQAVAPQVAAQAAQILTGDTQGVGTSAQAFGPDWYRGQPEPGRRQDRYERRRRRTAAPRRTRRCGSSG